MPPAAAWPAGPARTFPPASSSCRPPRRRAMDALYAFMRHTDDLVDDAASAAPREALAPMASTRPGRAALAAAMLRRRCRSRRKPPALLPALADAVRPLPDSARAPHGRARRRGNGPRTSRATRHSRRWSRYCERVASAVGLACIHVWGFRGPEALDRPAGRHRPATDQYPPRPEGRRRGRPRLSPPGRPAGSATTRSSNCSRA